MTDRYEPASDFLKAVVANDVPLSGSEFGKANLRRLIAMTSDDDRSNRDWAALLLSQEDIDTAEVRDALLRAASDEDPFVRGEAILGLARRDRGLALPLVKKALSEDAVTVPIFEAAALLAHPSLVDDLRDFAVTSDEPYADQLAMEALAACQGNVPPK